MAVAHDPGSLLMISLVIAAVVVVFWRTAIKLATIGVAAVLLLGLLELLRDLH